MVFFRRFSERGKLELSQNRRQELLQSVIQITDKHSFPILRTVAQHYLNFIEFENKKKSIEQMFVAVQKIYEQMEQIGFQHFTPYELPRLLMHLARFMYNLDDFEKTILYLQQVKKFHNPYQKWDLHHVLRLNLLQSAYQKQEQYDKALACAKEILAYASQKMQRDEYEQKRARIWHGIALLDIASMSIYLQKPQEGEPFAEEGYRWVCVPAPDNIQTEAEFEALQILIDIKLRLQKHTQVDTLLKRCETIKPFLGDKFIQNAQKQIPYYKNLASYLENKGNYKEALHFNNIAKKLQDSLNKQNDKNKLQKAQQRLDAEKYAQKIKLIEQEQALQRTLLYVALVVLLLVVLIIFVNYRRVQTKRNLALQSLENYMQAYKEKSEMLETLKEEIDKRTDEQARHTNLLQLQQATILTQEDWSSFKLLFEKVYPKFIEEQKTLYPDLTPAELRFLMLEKLNLNVNEMANMLGISPNSVHKTQQRLRKKM
jgi:tetratricopeptide (TPR) repeat protein